MKVLVFGPESSGSALITRIVGLHMGIKIGGYGRAVCLDDVIEHTSLPCGKKSKFPPVDEMVLEFTHVIITTRDTTISQLSKGRRFKKLRMHSEMENRFAAEFIRKVMEQDVNYFIWSYETFMLLGDPYLNTLLDWLDLKPVPYEHITDQNKKYIK